MRSSDYESDYFDDDNFVVPDDGDDVTESRPAKRPRVRPPTRLEDHNASSDDFSDIDEETFHESELSAAHNRADTRSKNRSFVPKRSNIQENIFVTQLTQPHSSPDRIRGPRWKKPEPLSPRPDIISTPQNSERRRQSDQFSDDDYDELRAALAASLDSFEVEEAARSPLSINPPTKAIPAKLPPPVSTNQAVPQDMSFELDDIPDDAFDSSPCLSPVARPAQPASFSSNISRHPSSFRQTTLYGMIQSNPGPSQQDQDPGPPDKVESPTHHKLNHDALNTWWYPTNLGTTRDYQYNITQKGLFHNLLVALPTGLGKTFIAATVMLNWFRWTKDAQIIFVAPTKPLVSQQVSACLDIAGIPRSQTTMLTGGAPPGVRAQEWQSKRVFFMTPQTLINDLKTGIADPKRIVLVVVDEAHRATGGYAYVEVVKFLRRFSNSFRVLALTATPGSTVEAVQGVIDGLEISRVEIRTENSLDIRDYVHARNIEIETFEYSEEIQLCLDLMSAALQPQMDQLRTLNAYWGKDPLMLTAFGLTKARQQWMASDAGRNASFGLKGMVNAIFTLLASLAHGLDLLKYHGIVPFYRHLLHFKSNTDGQKGGKYQKQVVQNESFKKLVNYVDPWSKNPEFIGHPKLEYLKSVILNHFMDAGEGKENADNTQSGTRVMIFVHFRDSAEEVARVLKRYEPMIRPHIFVGQSSAKGSEGMSQKTQLDIIQKFKGGTYNTIVATSIGEEGLDIGEVDRIVCYDSSASPIRMLQRMGRTGRKRAGNITLLLMKGKEEDSYVKAKDNYEKMQEMIASGTRFNFHDDLSARILPPGIRPLPDKRIIEIPQENSQQELPEPKRKGRAPKRPPKKFHMPDDVETGFTRASTLGEDGAQKEKSQKEKATKTPNKRKTATPKRAANPEPELATPPTMAELNKEFPNAMSEYERAMQQLGDITNPRTGFWPRPEKSVRKSSRPTKRIPHSSLSRRIGKLVRNMDRISPRG
ncbi:ATP-dependent DNA helicase mph1 [Penicillium odoratum]|uniref:ATP-dependent DNA helicase mph1 n=1 Tax=Penicillium odoratum TaxID=1167516 RepID=UPI002548322E|nr:ATP-dependent DNA helicase mph1 [Penicillium odoratum]KAJ5758898.1 ATP-dependent DNA helicase mph1 [Penicillium odoratum]